MTNRGTTDRIHLVIDGLRNLWTDDVFRQAGYDFAEEARGRMMDSETTQRVIDELRARGFETDCAWRPTWKSARER